jgi:hypothetical protein
MAQCSERLAARNARMQAKRNVFVYRTKEGPHVGFPSQKIDQYIEVTASVS